jgi:cell migration-inducing and hyaluronan-binding protein
MRKKNRSLFLMSLISASLLVSMFVVVQAQNSGAAAGKATNWSDPATWPSRKVPVAGDRVVIEKDKQVVLDVTPPALNGLTINGKLSFANTKDIELTTEWIMLHGELEIGTEKAPHTRKATITFTNNVKDEDISGVGGTTNKVDRGIMLMGGTLNLHGDRTNAWTKLSGTAALSWRPRISIRGKPSGAPSPPSGGIRSRSTGSSTTCTSARSPSTWMNAAKSAC